MDNNETNGGNNGFGTTIPRAVKAVILIALAAVIGTAVFNVGIIPIAAGGLILYWILKKCKKD